MDARDVRREPEIGAGKGAGKGTESTMSDSFREREKSFEAKYKLDEELRFRAEARRNRMLGEWVADALGLSGDDKKAYARDVVDSDFAEPGYEDVIRKVMSDIKERGARLTEEEVRSKMIEFEAQAVEQVKGEYPESL